MTKIVLDLTVNEQFALAEALSDLRDKQGDGSLPDDLDDALVTLNDKIEAALRGDNITD